MIDSSVCCKEGHELCGTKCVGEASTHTFVDMESKGDHNKKDDYDKSRIESVTSCKNYIMACMEVNTFDYAKLLLVDDSDTGLGGGALRSQRRSSSRRTKV